MNVLDNFFKSCRFSSKTVPNGSALYNDSNVTEDMGNVVHRKYYSLDELSIQRLENEVNETYHTEVVFPKWYREFLSYANGISFFHGAISLYGLQTINRTDPLHESPFSLYRENLGRHKKIPKEWLFIGSYSMDKTKIVIDTKRADSRVFCIYNMDYKEICSWNSFEEFLSSELQRLNKMYEEKPWGWRKGFHTLPDGHKDKK